MRRRQPPPLGNSDLATCGKTPGLDVTGGPLADKTVDGWTHVEV